MRVYEDVQSGSLKNRFESFKDLVNKTVWFFEIVTYNLKNSLSCNIHLKVKKTVAFKLLIMFCFSVNNGQLF